MAKAADRVADGMVAIIAAVSIGAFIVMAIGYPRLVAAILLSAGVTAVLAYVIGTVMHYLGVMP